MKIMTQSKSEAWAEQEITRLLTAADDCRWIYVSELHYHICIPTDGMDMPTIAGIFGCSTQAIHATITKAMDKMKGRQNGKM